MKKWRFSKIAQRFGLAKNNKYSIEELHDGEIQDGDLVVEVIQFLANSLTEKHCEG
jgi:hypothetical protein